MFHVEKKMRATELFIIIFSFERFISLNQFYFVATCRDNKLIFPTFR